MQDGALLLMGYNLMKKSNQYVDNSHQFHERFLCQEYETIIHYYTQTVQ